MTRGEALKKLISASGMKLNVQVVFPGYMEPVDAQTAIKIWETLNKEAETPEDPATEITKTETPEEPAKKARRKLDGGKMRALRAAGWTYYEIADEMGCSPQTVHNYLNPKKTEG